MTSKRDKQAKVRRLASIGTKYDVAFFARKHGLDIKDARRIVETHGTDRDAADRAAIRFKQ
ncbi:DUF3606 domain-containing protein [Pararhizobium sp. BT-229]|uniref:DUF3606 domain-containing protein n=1 Tax=Pararhizobium sp. BT-229 TaxID=2986923 RepID=UPI0021F7CFA5|nr:DUF3606 domain-containing protein [Pararhizobium sp. BT-229]MCV9967728.1 DUF3606 domain-containing protein [Pararhizobium sp. BT-229]